MRDDAASKRQRLKSSVPHRRRPEHDGRNPVRLTLQVRPELGSLRTPERHEIIKGAISDANERFGMRMIEYAIEDSEITFVVEADDEEALTLGAQGLSIRIARGLNRHLDRTGEVFVDRYRTTPLKTEMQVRRAVAKVLWQLAWKMGKPWYVDPYSSAAPEACWHDEKRVVVAPRTVLLTRAVKPPS
jgi:hypothetical protein